MGNMALQKPTAVHRTLHVSGNTLQQVEKFKCFWGGAFMTLGKLNKEIDTPVFGEENAVLH